jgi:hypothetical protein
MQYRNLQNRLFHCKNLPIVLYWDTFFFPIDDDCNDNNDEYVLWRIHL